MAVDYSQYAPAGIDPNTWNEMAALADQWDTFNMGRTPITEAELEDMAHQGIMDSFWMGQYMAQHHDLSALPWSQVGVTQDAWDTMTTDLIGMIQEQTGLDPNDIPRDMMMQYFIGSRGKTDPALWKNQFMQNADNRKRFGWIKYGMNYNQFQDFKTQNARKFGHELTNEEGVNWLDEQATQQAAPVEGGREVQARPESQSGQQKATPAMAAIR